jgi:hypothetical protein
VPQHLGLREFGQFGGFLTTHLFGQVGKGVTNCIRNSIFNLWDQDTALAWLAQLEYDRLVPFGLVKTAQV